LDTSSGRPKGVASAARLFGGNIVVSIVTQSTMAVGTVGEIKSAIRRTAFLFYVPDKTKVFS